MGMGLGHQRFSVEHRLRNAWLRCGPSISGKPIVLIPEYPKIFQTFPDFMGIFRDISYLDTIHNGNGWASIARCPSQWTKHIWDVKTHRLGGCSFFIDPHWSSVASPLTILAGDLPLLVLIISDVFQRPSIAIWSGFYVSMSKYPIGPNLLNFLVLSDEFILLISSCCFANRIYHFSQVLSIFSNLLLQTPNVYHQFPDPNCHERWYPPSLRQTHWTARRIPCFTIIVPIKTANFGL